MTVSGDFADSGGTLVLNTVLGGDASVTDRLVVNGNTSGAGQLKVVNAGGVGAPTIEGIKLVQVNGSSEATLTLTGNYVHEGQQSVVGGAYAYKLYKNGVASPSDGDWYLRSQLKNPGIPTDPVDPGGPTDPTEPNYPAPPVEPAPQRPLYQAGASGYEAYPQALLGLNRVSTLQQRVGTRVWSGKGNRVIAQGADTAGAPYASPDEAGSAIGGNGVWGRIEGTYQKINPRLSTSDSAFDQNIFRMQAGLDTVLTQTASGTLIGGVTAHYTHGRTGTHSVHGDVEISTDGYGFGGNLTWYGENGLYLDGQGQVTWYRSDLHSLLANTGLTRDNGGFGYALSVEGGQRIAIDPAWSVTPQAQLAYSSVDFDNFVDVFRAPILLERGDSLQGRLGMTLDYQSSWQNSQGTQDRAHIYGVANLYYEFLEGTKVAVAETSLSSRDERLWAGLGIGGSYSWNDDKYTIYGEGLLDTSLASFADSYSIKGQIGFRVKW
ncbi:autotransporter outer membrane beta-barrel domain-containing protein [Ochrobactrum quorumnocens]|uniref:Autotransporter outer membrane beta-barrel domain-containing protein n=2 Tax=Ochrobactrum quorumnocens TaxID=271865 RepID=A0A5N1JDT3_9HYPH|nr:autotransporter outer membrane beta-barrel domain-containing protein [[Ochrobactrum] quorumnocens]